MGAKIGKLVGNIGKLALGTTRFKNQSELPIDIIMNILSRLAVKDIIKFRSVCKLWRDISLDPYFVKLHMSQSPTRILVAKEIKDNSCDTEDNAKDSPEASDCRILSSCNGLLVIREGDGSFHIWNPATHRKTCIPNPPPRWFYMRLYHVQSTGKFKLVCICHLKKTTRIRFSILTIGGRWRKLSRKWGDLYCLAGDAPHLVQFKSDSCNVFSFDIDSERLTRNKIPDGFQIDYSIGHTSDEWMGRFAIVSYTGKALEACILHDYKNHKWVKEIVDMGKADIKEFRCHLLNHDREVWFISESGLSVYNMETLETVDYTSFDDPNMFIGPYMPTLASCEDM